MAIGPPWDARFGKFVITDNDGTTTRDLSAFLTGVDGLPGSRELIDTSKISDSGRTFTPGLVNGTFVLEGNYDQTNPTGPDRVLPDILAMSTATAFAYHPTGDDCGTSPNNRAYSGNCWIRSYTITGRVASVITFRADGQVEGIVTVGNSTALAH